MHDVGAIRGRRVDPVKAARAKELRRRMTPAEQALWRHLRTNQLHGLHFRRQQVLDGFIADFYCHAARLLVEVDGGVHQLQADYDCERDRLLAARGVMILRFSNDDVQRNLSGVLQHIATLAAERRRELTPWATFQDGKPK